MLDRQTMQHVHGAGPALGALLAGFMGKMPLLLVAQFGHQGTAALRAETATGQAPGYFANE